MTDDNRAALLAAVNRLVAGPDAPELYEALHDAVPVARRLGMRFTQERAELNPLLDLACTHPEHYNNALELIETKRETAGLPPLDPKRKEAEGYDRTKYMADFMRQKRERERKAAEIENLIRPEGQQLVGRARLDFMQLQSAKWKKQLDALIAARYSEVREGGGERIPKAELTALRQSFWDQVDRELDEMYAYAKAEAQKPANKRRPFAQK
jgi:hypothetical protein